MKLKTHLTFGVGLLFFLIVLLTGTGMGYVSKLKKDTNNILTSNHLSVYYAQNMLKVLNKPSMDTEDLQLFERNLENQKNNVTEKGGRAVTGRIGTSYEKLLDNTEDTELRNQIRSDLLQVMHLNMQAIRHKSDLAAQTANTAILWITATGTVCFGIAFILLINLPRSIADPILELLESTREIAQKNYSKRVSFKGNNEFQNLARSFNKMAEKLEEYSHSNLEKLLIEKKRIETIINSMYEPIIGLDEHDNLLFINKSALKIAHLEAENTIGKNIMEIARENDIVHLLMEDIPIEQDQSQIRSSLKLYVDGKKNYFEKEYLSISKDPDNSDRTQKTGSILILHNITAHKKQDLAKTNFIASLSHNFKTPISSIQISLQLLKKHQIGDLNPKQEELIEEIEEDTRALLRSTGKLLKITEVESGEIQLNITAVNLPEVAQYAINTLQKQAGQKQIELKLDIPGKVPMAKGDTEKIAWVLINLISNAIRYSKIGSTVSICIENKKEKIYLSVKDQGRGILPEYKDKVFRRYFRAPNTHEKGTGLGLAISKEFIEALGGKIDVESTYGKGSKFTITLKKE